MTSKPSSLDHGRSGRIVTSRPGTGLASRLEQFGLASRKSLQFLHHFVKMVAHRRRCFLRVAGTQGGENGPMLAERILVAPGRRQKQAPRPLELGPRRLD